MTSAIAAIRGKNRLASAVGIIDVGDPDVREFVLRQIETRKLGMQFHGETLTIVRALTDNAKDRNSALFSAAEMLKKDARVREKDIEIVWDSRAVTVRREEAFKQPNGQGMGTFRGKFIHLTL